MTTIQDRLRHGSLDNADELGVRKEAADHIDTLEAEVARLKEFYDALTAPNGAINCASGRLDISYYKDEDAERAFNALAGETQ